MAGPLQIEGMDAQQIAERHVVERYFAGQLSESEALAFEAYVEAHPEIVRDIEEVARMKSGLATLKMRGELPSFKATPGTSWSRWPAVIAASVAILAFGLLMFRKTLFPEPQRTLLAATIQDLAGNERPPTLIAAITLTRSRGAQPETLYASPQESFVMATLELFADDLSAPYSAQILRVADGKPTALAKIDNLHVNAEGNLVLFLREEDMPAGDYLIRVSTPGETAAADFALRVAR